MSFRPDMKNIVQDMPPPGGFPKVRGYSFGKRRGVIHTVPCVCVCVCTELPFLIHTRTSNVPFCFFYQVDWAATTRPRGPSGLALWAGATALILYGFTRVGAVNKEMQAEKLMEREARYMMAAILQEEADRKFLAQERERMKKETELLGKDLPPIYRSNRWVAPNTNPLNKNIGK
jgi:hypothetical protein